MTALATLNPIPQYFDLDGSPLDAGQLYFGQPNQNPETSPIAVYWDADGTQPVAQPVRTSNGYTVRAGTPAVVYAAGDYSLTIRDKRGVMVVYAQSASSFSNVLGLSQDISNSTDAGKGAGQIGFSHSIAYASGVGLALQLLLNVKNKPFNCKVDGVTDDLGGLNAALSTPRPMVIVPDGDLLVSTTPTNDYGVRMWPGRVLTPITGGLQQLNTYADDDKIFIGKEYLYRIYERLRLSGNIKTFLYGDSTVAANNTTSSALALTSLLPAMVQAKGLTGSMLVTNRGVSGTQISDLNALPDLAIDTDLFVIKYGINDGANPIGTRLDTFKNTLRAKLSAIRGSTYGGVNAQAIVLMGPNSTSDTPNGRDERWYEQLRGIYIQAARDFKCMYFVGPAKFISHPHRQVLETSNGL